MDRAVVREELAKRKSVYPLKCASSVIDLPGKTETLKCELQALRIGDYLLLTIPGEPMVEYGFQIDKLIADRATPIVIGYANGDLGYICTAESHQYGGYEPNQSKLKPEAEPLILEELGRLADKVLADVFESFKPTKGSERRVCRTALSFECNGPVNPPRKKNLQGFAPSEARTRGRSSCPKPNSQGIAWFVDQARDRSARHGHVTGRLRQVPAHAAPVRIDRYGR